MERVHPLLYPTLTIILLAIAPVYKILSVRRRKPRLNLPPCPVPPLPIIGHLHLIKRPLQRTLHELFQQGGNPIFSLWFGSRLIVVASSISIATKFLTEKDTVFANRPRLASASCTSYNNTTISTAAYGDHWRNLRRLMTLWVFSSARLNAHVGLRRDETRVLISELYRKTLECGRNELAKIEMRPRLFKLSSNIIMRVVAGERCREDEAKKLHVTMREVVATVAGVSSHRDFLPLLRWIDHQGMKKKLARIGRNSDEYAQGLLDDHRKKGKILESHDSMIAHLLSLQKSEPQYYTDEIIKGLIMMIIIPGIDTTSLTIEWGLTLLLNHPEVLKKVRDEVDSHIGQDRFVEESDLNKLHYLQCVLNETLRLYPPAPLLAPHMASEDCKVGSYDIPSNTILVINAWTIHRDPLTWDEPNTFKPERFEGGETKGFLPFGIGRRSCPGSSMATNVACMTLAILVQCFEWKRVSEEPVDTTENKSHTMPKSEPLEALCKPREIMSKLQP